MVGAFEGPPLPEAEPEKEMSDEESQEQLAKATSIAEINRVLESANIEERIGWDYPKDLIALVNEIDYAAREHEDFRDAAGDLDEKKFEERLLPELPEDYGLRKAVRHAILFPIRTGSVE